MQLCEKNAININLALAQDLAAAEGLAAAEALAGDVSPASWGM